MILTNAEPIQSAYEFISTFNQKRNKILRKQMELPAGNYLLKLNNRNTRTRCEICSKLTIKTSERLLVIPDMYCIDRNQLCENVKQSLVIVIKCSF